MKRVVVYSLLLILGMVIALAVDLSTIRFVLTNLTMICLSYIMIEVGLEFTLNKSSMRSYGKDYLIAATAALFPWIFCALYFIWVVDLPVLESFVIGRFAAPTSAGVLFTMLAAAGLGTTWLFQKARILAIFDDIDTILIMIPLQMLIIGLNWSLIVVIPIIAVLLWAAYRFLHTLRWPIHPWMLLLYGAALVFITELLEHQVAVQLEVILPAFVLGCILYNPHDPTHPEQHTREHAFIEPEPRPVRQLDTVIKGLFMFLVGVSLPPIQFNGNGVGMIIVHILAITVLSNLGKSFPIFCYRKEATLRQRTALSVAMYPRGEVGAGVLLLVIDYGIRNIGIGLAEASLALNLLLTGVFIWVVIKLAKPKVDPAV